MSGVRHSRMANETEDARQFPILEIRILTNDNNVLHDGGMIYGDYALNRCCAELQRPGIEHLRQQAEILHITRDHGETVALGGGHDQAIHHRQGAPG